MINKGQTVQTALLRKWTQFRDSHTVAWERRGGKKDVFLAWHKLGKPWAIHRGCFLTCHADAVCCRHLWEMVRDELAPGLGDEVCTEANIYLIYLSLDILQGLLVNSPASTRVKHFDGAHKQRPSLQGSEERFIQGRWSPMAHVTGKGHTSWDRKSV